MTWVPFVHGTVTMGCVIAAVFFLRFWKHSQDRLFLHFSIAFLVLAISYLLLGTVAMATELRVYVFLVRLLAFFVILYAVFDKNRR